MSLVGIFTSRSGKLLFVQCACVTVLLMIAGAAHAFQTEPCAPQVGDDITTSLSPWSGPYEMCFYYNAFADTTDVDDCSQPGWPICDPGQGPCYGCQGDECWHEWKVKHDGTVVAESAEFGADSPIIRATLPGTYTFECIPRDWDPSIQPPPQAKGETGQMQTTSITIPPPAPYVDKSSITQCETTGAHLVPDPASCQPYTWYQLSGFDIAIVSGGGQVIPLKTGGGMVKLEARFNAYPSYRYPTTVTIEGPPPGSGGGGGCGACASGNGGGPGGGSFYNSSINMSFDLVVATMVNRPATSGCSVVSRKRTPIWPSTTVAASNKRSGLGRRHQPDDLHVVPAL